MDRDHPESRKGRRKSSPLYAADDELIHFVYPRPLEVTPRSFHLEVLRVVPVPRRKKSGRGVPWGTAVSWEMPVAIARSGVRWWFRLAAMLRYGRALGGALNRILRSVLPYTPRGDLVKTAKIAYRRRSAVGRRLELRSQIIERRVQVDLVFVWYGFVATHKTFPFLFLAAPTPSAPRTAIMIKYDFMPAPWEIPAASITA